MPSEIDLKSRQLADLLDSRFRIPGTKIRFGLDPVIGLIPGAGDWIGGVISLYFLVHAAALNANIPVLLRMLMNILLDIIIGSIPLFGEVFDVGWKANIKNARLLQDLQQNPGQTQRRSKIMIWSVCILSIMLVFALLYIIGWVTLALFQAV